ncbi:MAG: hypothetical protein HY870_16325 [Chloroflexi bacterium]|nr:hypothetical protein [Chloroflexota bacterium]
MNTVQDFPGATFAQWLSDNTVEIRTAGCEQGQSYSVNVETGARHELGALGNRFLSPDGLAFAEYSRSSVGLGGEFWLYDVARQVVIRPQGTQRRYDTLCWTPTSSHLIYTLQAMSDTTSSNVIIGPRQIWIVDKQGGEEKLLLGDSGHNYFIASGSPEQWRCVWENDWIQVQETSYIVVVAPTEPLEKDWDALACPIYGRNCEASQPLGLNWRTGKLARWEGVPSK